MTDLFTDLVQNYMDLGMGYEEAANKAMEDLPSLYQSFDDGNDRPNESWYQGKSA